MELDAAIQNALNRNPMESAMYGVGQDLGRQYELRALPRDISNTEDLLPVISFNAKSSKEDTKLLLEI